MIDEDVALVPIVDLARKQRRHELGRVMPLQVSRLVAELSIGSGVGLVEAVAGEEDNQIENLLRLFRGQATFLRPFDEVREALIGDGPVDAVFKAIERVTGIDVELRDYYVRSVTDRLWDRPATPNRSPFIPAEAYPAYVDHQNVRLFRRAHAIRFIGRVHESVGPSIEAAGLKLGDASLLRHVLIDELPAMPCICRRPTRSRVSISWRNSPG